MHNFNYHRAADVADATASSWLGWAYLVVVGSVVGYSMIQALAAGIGKAQSTDSEKLVLAFRGLRFNTPFGSAVFRPQDHQSTMGALLGRTKNEGGKGVMVDYRYIDGASVQPSDVDVKKLRPQD